MPRVVMRVPERAHSSDDETNEPSDRGDDDMHCRACGHDHAPGTTCGVCGHHREKCDRKANGVAECAARRRGDPIIEVIDKFLCLGAFEHTCREEVLLACGIRTVMNVRVFLCVGTRVRASRRLAREWVEGDTGVASRADADARGRRGGPRTRARRASGGGARVDGDARWRRNDGGFFVFENARRERGVGWRETDRRVDFLADVFVVAGGAELFAVL